MKPDLDEIDRRLLNLIQGEFPLTEKPFSALGLKLDISEEQAIHRIQSLKSEGIIRYIGPVFDARSLGYRVTLIAMRVTEHALEQAARVICEHPGVSHGYQRDHRYNLWFTLALPSERDLQAEIDGLAGAAAAEVAFDLPALRTFKLQAYFDAVGDRTAGPDAPVDHPTSSAKALSLRPMERAVVNELQQDLPLLPRPFALISEHLEIARDDFWATCQSLLQRGIMRRFCASVRHTSLGFVANAMVCWAAPPYVIERAGLKLAALREVSHCYERKAHQLWPYNLFAMVHERTREVCYEIVSTASKQSGLADYVVLFSAREFKKTRVKYLI